MTDYHAIESVKKPSLNLFRTIIQKILKLVNGTK